MNTRVSFPVRLGDPDPSGAGDHDAGRRPNAGFSLLELLVVMAVIGILAALSIPALQGLAKASGLNSAVSSLSMLLGQARAYAMAQNTYVWVGFNTDIPNTVYVSVVAGKTGAATDLPTSPSATPSTYVPVCKTTIFQNVSLNATVAGLTGMATAEDISNSVMTFTETSGGTLRTFRDVIQISPSGEVSLDANEDPPASTAATPPHWIQIGLQPAVGASVDNVNIACLQVSYLSGQVATYRK